MAGKETKDYSQYLQPDKPLSPEEFLLGAFTFFKTDKIELDGLVKIALAGGCPNEDVAKGVVSNMIRDGILGFEKLQDKVIITLPGAGPEQ